MSNPLVSIIIPIYNVEKYLPQCLDSVIAQTYSNLEVILINDGSPDNSEAICKQYLEKDSRIKYFKQNNGGLSNARNNGIKYAKGDYIFFLDSDDYISSTCIEHLAENATDDTLSVIGYVIDYSDEEIISDAKQSYGKYPDLRSFLLDFYKYFATKSNFAWGKLYDKKVIDKYNITFQEGVSLVEDILFNIQYYTMCNQSINMMPSDEYYYRQHGSSTLSKKFNRKMFDWNEMAFCAIRDFLKRNDAMTDDNRKYLYSDILGNLLYSTELLALNSSVPLTEKRTLINKYSSTQLAKEVFIHSEVSSARACLLSNMLKHHFAITYIVSQNIISILRNIYHAYRKRNQK